MPLLSFELNHNAARVMHRSIFALGAAMHVLIGGSAIAQPSGLSYPRAGVVCDAIGQTCYDSYGPSIGITGRADSKFCYG